MTDFSGYQSNYSSVRKDIRKSCSIKTTGRLKSVVKLSTEEVNSRLKTLGLHRVSNRVTSTSVKEFVPLMGPFDTRNLSVPGIKFRTEFRRDPLDPV